jgi:hypothetical protein
MSELSRGSLDSKTLKEVPKQSEGQLQSLAENVTISSENLDNW